MAGWLVTAPPKGEEGTMKKWNEEQQQEVMEYLKEQSRYISGAGWKAKALLNKLDPRPNFREERHDCCLTCKHIDCRDSISNECVLWTDSVCDNFERAP